ncbi:serine-rich adhesin for platelets-like [Cucumis melo var. makuwa]|uniref:Serine-rich adhesin for platelets-like n=1 Tax=Cucumis melo var. makuwa TaxID=1194695 RepID=A0A5A7UD29_CUCMM|nr:serine-rich adhesin for platelets-like [Cucumis melo var. makuwa]TYJ98081.1 serine-rich adhesin for platelets-like [Cucumis melo var. makuwa]
MHIINLVILKDTHIDLVIPKDAHISLVIPKDVHISLVISKDVHISLVIPKDAPISLVIPKDASISLVIPKDAQHVVILVGHRDCKVHYLIAKANRKKKTTYDWARQEENGSDSLGGGIDSLHREGKPARKLDQNAQLANWLWMNSTQMATCGSELL